MIIFHIGDPKTGSSSIQQALKHCIWDSNTKLVPQPELEASKLAMTLATRNKDGRAQAWAQRADWANNIDGDIGVISSEFFANFPAGRLKNATKDFKRPVRVVAYARPYPSRLIADYSQAVKAGGFIGAGGIDAFFDYSKKLHRNFFAPRFGGFDDTFDFHLKTFERDCLIGQDIVEDFFTTVFGGDDFTLNKLPPTNESLSVELLSGFRKVQRVLNEQGVPRFLRMSVGSSLGKKASQTAPKGRKLILSSKMASKLADYYSKDAKELDARFDTQMQKSLENMTTTDTAVKIVAPAYFDSQQITALDSLSRKLAPALTAQPKAWRTHFQIAKGQAIADSEHYTDSPDQQSNIATVESLLDALAAVISTPSSLQS